MEIPVLVQRAVEFRGAGISCWLWMNGGVVVCRGILSPWDLSQWCQERSGSGDEAAVTTLQTPLSSFLARGTAFRLRPRTARFTEHGINGYFASSGKSSCQRKKRVVSGKKGVRTVNDARTVRRLAGADGRSKSVTLALLARIRKAELKLPSVSSLTIRECTQ